MALLKITSGPLRIAMDEAQIVEIDQLDAIPILPHMGDRDMQIRREAR